MNLFKRKLEKQERKERKSNIIIWRLKYKKTEAEGKTEKFIQEKFKINNGVKAVEPVGRDQESNVI